MEISEIKDRDSLRAWLEDRPVNWVQAIASRSALRVIPVALEVVQHHSVSDETKIDLTVAVFRANLISSVARYYPTDEIADAADAADAAALPPPLPSMPPMPPPLPSMPPMPPMYGEVSEPIVNGWKAMTAATLWGNRCG